MCSQCTLVIAMNVPPWRLLAGVTALLALATVAEAQHGAGTHNSPTATSLGPARSARSAAGPAKVKSTAGGEIEDAIVTVLPVALRRTAVKSVEDKLDAADKSKPKEGGWLASLRTTVSGDKHRVEAGERVLEQLAQSLAADSSEAMTVVVVIGGADDRDKVVRSLAGVRRKVKVAYVDPSFADAGSDNTVLEGGLAGKLSVPAKNLWVYLPKKGSAPREKPNYTLSTKVASPALWNGMFAADGDAMDFDRLSLETHGDSGATSDTVAATGAAKGTTESSSKSAFAVGDVVLPKIANVKVLADALADSKVVGTASKSDELVIASAAKNGYIRVEGASLTGWVSLLLIAKR